MARAWRPSSASSGVANGNYKLRAKAAKYQLNGISGGGAGIS